MLGARTLICSDFQDFPNFRILSSTKVALLWVLGVRSEELAQQKTSICYRGHTTQIIEPKIGFIIKNLIYIDSNIARIANAVQVTISL